MSPRVSVILCGYNQAEYLRDAVVSVLNQSWNDFELLAIDNGSTDGSAAILMEFKSDPRVRLLLHSKNDHVTRRLNQAVALSSGEFISILYADDFYLREKLALQVARFDALPASFGVVHAPGFRLETRTGEKSIDRRMPYRGHVLRSMLKNYRSTINPISPLIRRECLLKQPFHDDVMIEGEAIFLRFALTWLFDYVDEPLVVMREHERNAGKAIKRNATVLLDLIERLKKEEDFPLAMVDPLEAWRGSLVADCSWQALRVAEDPSWARQCLSELLKRHPAHVLHPRVLAAAILMALPKSLVILFNQAFDGIRGRKKTAFKEDYR